MKEGSRLRARLNKLSSNLSSESEELTVDSFQRESPVAIRFRRMTVKLLFLIKTHMMQTVVQHWEAKAIKTTKPKPRPARRDDLNEVGDSLPVTKKEYPQQPETCDHVDSLRPTGGRRGAEPMYTWTCVKCGSRWNRVAAQMET